MFLFLLATTAGITPAILRKNTEVKDANKLVQPRRLATISGLQLRPVSRASAQSHLFRNEPFHFPKHTKKNASKKTESDIASLLREVAQETTSLFVLINLYKSDTFRDSVFDAPKNGHFN